MSIKIASVILITVGLFGVVAAEEIKTPQEQFSGYDTNIDKIPPDWLTSNPILLRVCFNLKYPVNSDEANAFLRELHSTISGMKYGVKIRVERAIYPVSQLYCASLQFENWEINRRYESSPEFLEFYEQRWKPAVTDVTEQLSVLDNLASAVE